MDLNWLRQQTATDHQAVETAVDLMHSSLTVTEYASTLQRFLRVVCAWESWAAEHVPPDLEDLLQQRRRCHLLQQDLAWLKQPAGLDQTSCTLFIDGALSREIFLGRMYVMEGSTLGGQYVAQHLERHFGWQPGEGDAYFRGHGKDTVTRWKEFQHVLRQLPETGAPTVVTAAKEMFTIFGREMQVALPPATTSHQLHPSL